MRPLLRTALAVTLLATAGLALWPDAPGPVVVAPVRGAAVVPAGPAPTTVGMRRPAAPAAPAAAQVVAPAPQLPTRAADWPAPSPTALAAWQPTSPTSATSPASLPPARARQAAAAATITSTTAPPPPAPVFPYRWIGQLDDGGAPQLLLASAQRSVAVRLGDTLDGRWRLQRSASGQLLAQALPDGATAPVPGAPLATPP